LSGTIEGFAKIGDDASTTCVSGDTGCVPFSLDGATVTIVEATGALDGYVGTGTYTYGDTFKLDDVVDAVNTVKNRVLGSSLRPTAASIPATMRLSLKQGAGSTVILRPAPARPGWKGVVSPRSPIVVVAPVAATCSVKLKAGSKKWTLPTATADSKGKATFKVTTTSLKAGATKLGVTLSKKPAVVATATCTKSGKTFTPKTENLKLSL
jgi:hypothetical protein